jgi:TonB-dependent starch-binding outer membrane protein SusC
MMLLHHRPSCIRDIVTNQLVFALSKTKTVKSMNKPKPVQYRSVVFFMRVTIVQILITGATLMLGHAYDTSGQEVLDRRVTLEIEKQEIKEVLARIESQIGVKFTYRTKLINARRIVSLSTYDLRLKELLDGLFEGSVEVSVIGKQVILKPTTRFIPEPTRTVADREVAKTVSGRVLDSDNQPIPGVNVLVKGTSVGTTSDADGNYTIEMPDESKILVFSFIGYLTQEVDVSDRTTVDVTLVADIQQLSEVVVVGYGEQKKVTVTGAVVAVGGKDLEKSPAIDLSNSFAGRLPGVVAVQTSGEPGYDGSTITIRGVNTLGNSSALIVIDGIPDRDGGFGRLSPQDVESISVLKDASSAIYGARAANGVILITTRRGKTGVPQISYDFNQGWAQPTRIPKMSNASEYASIMNEIPIYKNIPAGEWPQAWQAIQTTGTFTSPTNGNTVNANYSPADVQKYKDGSDPWGHPNTDWFGDAFRKWAPQSRHNLQISGGSESIRYLASIGYVNQDAYYKNSATSFQQYNFRMNVDAKINQYINTSLGVMAREEVRNFPTESAGEIFRMLMRGRPTEPEIWPNGLPGPDIENGQNPIVITTNATGYQRNPTDYLQGNGKVEFTNPWIEGLKLTLAGSVDKTLNRNKTWETPWYLYTWDKISYEADGVTPKLTKALRSTFTDPRLTQSEDHKLNTNLTGLLNYDRKVGDHTIGVLLGVTKEKFTGDDFFAYRRNFISPAIDQLFVGGGDLQNSGGAAYKRTRIGYYGRLTYNYKEKYLLELVGRRDGSYNFPPDKRFGFFPGILVGWNISNESFFSNVGFINYLKIRGSYGEMGNDQVYYDNRLIEYAFNALYRFGEYPIDSKVVRTLYEQIVPNNNFTWERAKNSNIGLDGSAFQGKLDFTFEYFYNKRDQILIGRVGSTPETSGIAGKLPPVNEGKVDNSGFEFKLDYHARAGELNYSIGANGGYSQNKVVYMDEIPGAPDYQKQTGNPYGAFLAYEFDGVFQNQEEIAANTVDYSLVTSQLIPGDMKFRDVNGDNKIDDKDRVRLNKTRTPTFNFGVTMNFTYKNFDLAILLQGATGALLFFGTESGDIGNYLKYSHDNRWSIDNPSNEHPRLAIRGDTYYTGGSYGANTYFLFSKNYIRIKNVELGYNVPESLYKKVGLNGARIYVNGLNLVTWDKYKIFDPEGDSGSGQYYPQARVINTGVRITF